MMVVGGTSRGASGALDGELVMMEIWKVALEVQRTEMVQMLVVWRMVQGGGMVTVVIMGGWWCRY